MSKKLTGSPVTLTRRAVGRFALLVALLLAGAACGERGTPTVQPAVEPTATSSTPIPTAAPTATSTTAALIATALPSPTTAPPTAPPSATPTPLPPTATPTATPDPYASLTIDALTARAYGGGEVEIVETLAADGFRRYLIRYPSDSLQIYGFLNVPEEGDRFPVALVLHGYIRPSEYETLAYTTRYADALTAAGYMVFHPNYRNYPPSDDGANPYRIGYAVDVLNLIAIIREQSQDPAGTLRRADAGQVHLMGHSMGGGVAQRVAVVRPDWIDAVVLYGSMTADESINFNRVRQWTGGRGGEFELAAGPERLAEISPITYFDRLRAPIGIHHGAADDVVPPAWSDDLCAELTARGHPVDCYSYHDMPHTFYGWADDALIARTISLFDRPPAR